MSNVSRNKGWRYDPANDRLQAMFNGTEVFDFDANDMVITPATTVTGALTVSAGLRLGGATASHFGFGAAETVTIASGVATVTKPYVILDAEGAGTTDTLDSISYAGQAAGDLLLLTVNATDTITADNSATMLLGAATRAIAPGGCLLLYATSATVWVELAFLTAAS